MSYDSDVVAATSGRGEADWDKLIKLCDRIRDSIGASAMSSALTSIMKRARHPDPLVQLQALTLLEACVSNCGKTFQLELTKPFFHGQVRDILTSRQTDSRVSSKLKSLLSGWSSEFKSDSQMSGLVRFVEQLGRDGVSLATSTAQQVPPSTQPRSQEESDLEKAIRMSLQEAQNQPVPSSYPNLSPQPQSKPVSTNKKKVRAIYDFEAAEDNELTFKAGEIITVLDDSDESWWKGETQLGTGLFPANFVSADLKANPEPVRAEKSSSATTSAGGGGGASGGVSKVTVNEAQVDLLLEMLKTADITSTDPEENKTFQHLEDECKQMKILVDNNIASLDRQAEEMNEVSEKLQEAFSMYRKLLQEGPRLATLPPPSLSAEVPSGSHSQLAPPPYQPYTAPQPSLSHSPSSQYYHTQPEVASQSTQPQGYASLAYAPPLPSSISSEKQPFSLPDYTQQQSLAPPVMSQQPSSLPDFSAQPALPPPAAASQYTQSQFPTSQFPPSQAQPTSQMSQLHVQYQPQPHPHSDPAASNLWSSPPMAGVPTQAGAQASYSSIPHHYQQPTTYTQPLSIQQPLL